MCDLAIKESGQKRILETKEVRDFFLTELIYIGYWMINFYLPFLCQSHITWSLEFKHPLPHNI